MAKTVRRVIGCLTIFMVAGCGVVDEGQWDPTNTIVKPSPTPEVSGVEIGSFTPRLAEPELPAAPIAEKLGLIGCEIPDVPTISLDGAEQIPYYKQDDSICLGEEYQTSGLSFCQAVMAFEQRAAAIGACFINALDEMDRQGTRVLGHDWYDLAIPMLQPAWSLNKREVTSLVGAVSTEIIEKVLGEFQFEAPGTPFCFWRAPHTTPEEVKTAALAEISESLRDTEVQLAHIFSALQRGVDLQVTKDLRLQVEIRVLKAQAKVESINACYFQAQY